jgi:molybdopterin-containing oxidoreductase family iron-sulfur binding subunit
MMATGESSGKEMNRRDFLKVGGLAVAGGIAVATVGQPLPARGAIAGKKLAMVIDLQRCVACGACIIACKNENNLQGDVAWASRISRTVGTFPNVRLEVIVTLCNHCENAPCVRGCPTGAMHKGDGDITTHDPGKCIGCRYCIVNCPYEVIHFNEEETHQFWRDNEPLMEGITPSAAEVTREVGGTVIPYYNPDRERSHTGTGLRYKGIVEKCTLCDHRLKKGELPYCVEACPAKARIFGDLNDPNSEVNQILGKFPSWRLKEHLGTQPKVFYVRSFNPGTYEKTAGSI